MALAMVGMTSTAQADTVKPGVSAPTVVVQAVPEPLLANAGPSIAPVDPTISVGGCGFLKNCIYFNQQDQRAIIAGGIAAATGLVCLISGPACVVAGVVAAVAFVYLSSRGICSNNRRLRVRWFPNVGDPTCVA